jgi:hypothetical protein
MDNWFTSIPLISDLKNKGFYVTGTVRTNRKGLHKPVTMLKSEEKDLKKTPGITRFASQGDLCYISWFDKRAVHMLSNAYVPEGDDTVEHWYKAKAGEQGATESGKVKRAISIPPIIKKYRANMGGVDFFDQFRSYYKLELRCFKYWHPIFWFIFNQQC